MAYLAWSVPKIVLVHIVCYFVDVEGRHYHGIRSRSFQREILRAQWMISEDSVKKKGRER